MNQTPLTLPSGLRVSVNRYDDPPPGLPDRCFVVSNSERQTAICDRRYLLSVIEGLKPPVSSAPARYGQLYHDVKESVYEAWLQDRAPTPDEINQGLHRAKEALKKDVENQRLTPEDVLDIYGRLESSIDAWLHIHGGGQPPKSYKLVAYEQSFAMPVMTPSGHVYKPDMFLVETKEGSGTWRIARSNERDRAVKVNWPWFFIGKLDMLFQHRSRGGLYVADDKTTKSPKALLKKLTNDPQVPSYLSLARYNIDQGNIEGIAKGTPILGFWHRITNSAGFRDPKTLKGRKKAEKDLIVGLSTAKNVRVTSWNYRATLVAHGFDPNEPKYAEMIDFLRRERDEYIEMHEHSDYPTAELARFARELYADVKRISAMWRAAMRAKTIEDLDLTHRRVPVCQSQNWECPFVGPCIRDGDEVRARFKVKPWLTWAVPKPAPAATPTTSTSNATPESQLGW